MSSSWITEQRPPRTGHLDPLKPHGFFLEQERMGSGKIASTATILLTNKECPWRCLMCDLWKNTLTYSVPAGAIPRQIDFALSALGERPEQVKLYNSGSFFDAAAIPRGDYAAVGRSVGRAENVVVESHPRLVGEQALRLRDLLEGSLEVAMGLETTHPEAFPRLNKKFTLGDFADATEYLRSQGMTARAFVLVNPPFVGAQDGIEWAVRTAEFAFDCGVGVVSLIPTRGGNGAMERLLESGDYFQPRVSGLEEAQERVLQFQRGRVFADTWDLEKFSQCSHCLEARRKRLHLINLSQQLQPRVDCPHCGGA